MKAPHRRALGAALATCLALPALACAGLPARAAVTGIADDGFDRSTATIAGAWDVRRGNDTVRVDSSQASFRGGAGTVFEASLPAATATDTQVDETIVVPRLPADGHVMVALTARYDPRTGTAYRMWFRIRADGRIAIQADRKTGGSSDVSLGSAVFAPGTFAPGTRVNLRMGVTGTDRVQLGGTAWTDGTARPEPQYRHTDDSTSRLSGPGRVGTAMVVAQGEAELALTHFRAYDTAGDEPAPVPTTPAPTTPAPAPTTPAPSTPATPGRGAVPVGQASYPVPAGAIHVSPSGNDGASGTQGSPLRTLDAAVAKVPSGGTIVLHAGTYHQGEVGIFKPLTIQNAPGEAVWLDGSSVVTGWTQSGTTWRAPWSTQWDHSSSYSKGHDDASFIDPNFPMAAWPDQVFLDGRQLKQVPLAQGVQAGQFAVDQANRQLVIGSNPAGHELRASDRDRVLTIGSPDVTLRGVGIRRYANAIHRLGVIFSARQRVLVQNVVIEDVATIAISMTSDGKNGSGHVDRTTIRRTGLAAITGEMFDGGRVTNSVITQNNTEGFNALPSTAGIKVGASRNVTFDNNLITENFRGTGIWTDESVVGVTATRNRVTNSASDGFAGIQLELTSDAVVADNVVSGFTRGLYLYNSERLRVRNNTVWDSRVGDISVDQDRRRQWIDEGYGQQDPRYPLGDPTNTWITRDVVIHNNVFGTEQRFSNFQLYVLDKHRSYTADQMVSSATGNAFEAPGTDVPTTIGWGRNDATVTQYKDIDQWSAAVGRGWVNKYFTANASPAEAQRQADAMGHGTPLESDIATKIGQSAGSRHIGTFQQV